MAKKHLTDEELEHVAVYIARRYLEVERGLRGKECLQRYLSFEAYSRQYAPEASRFGNGGIVRQSDLGRVTLQRPQTSLAYIVITARQEGDRWGALLMEMRANKEGVWRVTELTRAQDRNLVKPVPMPRKKQSVEPERLAASRAHTVLAAQTARKVAEERYIRVRKELARLMPEKPAGELQPGDRVNTGTVQEQRWNKVRGVVGDAVGDVIVRAGNGTVFRVSAQHPIPVLAADEKDLRQGRREAAEAGRELLQAAEELARWDRQLVDLGTERGLSDQRTAEPRRAEARSMATPPLYMARTLGPPPGGAEARKAWDEAAAAIEAYRNRWEITRMDCALGQQPEDPQQRAERDATVAALRDLTARIRELDHDRSTRRASDRSAAPERVDAGPFALAAPGGRP